MNDFEEKHLEDKIGEIRKALHERPGNRLAVAELSNTPMAAVCLVLKPSQDRARLLILLLRRIVSDSDPWSGHMALPGGRSRNYETDVFETAKRELMEEAGIDARKCEFLGTLDELLPGNKSIRVTPFVFLASETVEATIDQREIAYHVWIPLDFFLDKKNSVAMEVEVAGKKFEVPSYSFAGQHIVWGMTLRIIQDFISKIQ